AGPGDPIRRATEMMDGMAAPDDLPAGAKEGAAGPMPERVSIPSRPAAAGTVRAARRLRHTVTPGKETSRASPVDPVRMGMVDACREMSCCRDAAQDAEDRPSRAR